MEQAIRLHRLRHDPVGTEWFATPLPHPRHVPTPTLSTSGLRFSTFTAGYMCRSDERLMATLFAK